MLFNSIQFIIFFPIIVFLFFMMPHKYRTVLLLVASYYFYMCWKAEYIILIIVSTLIDYFCAIKMEESEHQQQKKKFLIISLFSNLGLLFLFKYYNFFSDNLQNAFNVFNIFYDLPSFKMLLPVGISFYTFQTLSYSIDVYRGKKKAERNITIFALYVAFFPQLVAGPIERSTRLIPQFYIKQKFDYERVRDGLLLMLWGFFKKVVIADRLAILVNQVFNNVHDYKGIPLIIASYFFMFQIYCDFSGYSDIAIGGAKVMGFDLMKNFNRPYFATSISDYWKRWHISLGSWFRDYLYIPLGGNRVSRNRWYFNIFMVFLITGIWHGAGWNFIIWGVLQAFFIIFSMISSGLRGKIADFFHLPDYPLFQHFYKIFITFHLLLFGKIIFRSNSISDAYYIFKNFFADLGNVGYDRFHFGLNKYEFVLSVLLILFLTSIQIIQSKIRIRQYIYSKPLVFRWACYYLLLFIVIHLGEYNSTNFIYFSF